jgi:N-acetylneuraminic acid mutarotase
VPVTPVAGPPPDTEAKKANDTSEPNKAADTSAEKSVSEGVAEPATGKPREDVAVDKPEEKPEPKPKKDAGELKISARHGIQESYEDTIYIDKEGNLRQSDDIDMSLTAPDAS